MVCGKLFAPQFKRQAIEAAMNRTHLGMCFHRNAPSTGLGSLVLHSLTHLLGSPTLLMLQALLADLRCELDWPAATFNPKG